MESNLLDRWTSQEETLVIHDLASISQLREWVKEVGNRIGLAQHKIDEFLIVATELAQNQIRHAISGEMLVRDIRRFEVSGIELVAVDHGSGISDPTSALLGLLEPDGISLKGGLGAVYRLSDQVDFDNRLGEGSCIWARKFVSLPPNGCEAAIFGRPFPGEMRSGDDGIFYWDSNQMRIAVVDGFGHGTHARESSEIAVATIKECRTQNLSFILKQINERIQDKRAVMLSMGAWNSISQVLEILCLGDVRAMLFHLDQVNHFSCHQSRILGECNLAPFQYRGDHSKVAPGDLLILHTDGLSEGVSEIAEDFELRRKPAIVIAQYLIEKYCRSTDDALVLVIRFSVKGAI